MPSNKEERGWDKILSTEKDLSKMSSIEKGNCVDCPILKYHQNSPIGELISSTPLSSIVLNQTARPIPATATTILVLPSSSATPSTAETPHLCKTNSLPNLTPPSTQPVKSVNHYPEITKWWLLLTTSSKADRKLQLLLHPTKIQTSIKFSKNTIKTDLNSTKDQIRTLTLSNSSANPKAAAFTPSLPPTTLVIAQNIAKSLKIMSWGMVAMMRELSMRKPEGRARRT